MSIHWGVCMPACTWAGGVDGNVNPPLPWRLLKQAVRIPTGMHTCVKYFKYLLPSVDFSWQQYFEHMRTVIDGLLYLWISIWMKLKTVLHRDSEVIRHGQYLCFRTTIAKSTSVWIMTLPCISYAVTLNGKTVQNIVMLAYGMHSKWKFTPF